MTYVSRLENALTSLLNDEEVKSLPCYKLLYHKYNKVIERADPAIKSPKLVKCECGVFYKSETHFASEKHIAFVQNKNVKEKPIIPVKVQEDPVQEDPVQEDPVQVQVDPVYQVEIKGTIYLNQGDLLYDATTYKKIGSIGKSGFIIGTKVIPIKTKKTLRLMEASTDWIDDDQTVYTRVNDHIARAIGVFENELQLWD